MKTDLFTGIAIDSWKSGGMRIKKEGVVVRTISTAWLALVLSACGRADSEPRPMVDTTDTRSKPLLTLTEELPDLQRFNRALAASGYRDLLAGTGPFTVFAPLDDGFLRTIRADSSLAAGPADSLARIVALHVVRGSIEEVWGDSLVVASMAQHPVTMRKTPEGLRIQGHPVLHRYAARNGMLYVIPSTITIPPPDTTRGVLAQLPTPL